MHHHTNDISEVCIARVYQDIDILQIYIAQPSLHYI